MTSPKITPFKHEYFLGYISQVMPQFVKIHFPSSVLLNGFTHLGKEFNGGLVGSFVVIEGDKYGFLGRISELSLPESERLSLNEKAFQTSDFHPTGKIEILLSFDLYDPFTIKRGLTSYPNIGAKVFVSSGELIQKYMARFGIKEGENQMPAMLGHLVTDPSTCVSVGLQSIFGRHCAVVGTTGGGKSYTASKLIELLISTDNKAILIDATGEYDGPYPNTKSVTIGNGTHVFHYSQLTIDDLFFLFHPSPKTQAPKLMEAIRSLKVVELNNGQNLTCLSKDGTQTLTTPVDNGLVLKSNAEKRPFDVFYYQNIAKIEGGSANFNINKLASQLTQECVYDNPLKWGGQNLTEVSYCVSLIARINNIVNGLAYQNVFGFNKPKDGNDIVNVISDFLSGTDNLLRLNFGNVPFDYQIREILANAIAKNMLMRARNKDFKDNPIVLFVDESHQFLNKKVNDDYLEIKPLDAFDSIAKECRKHGLFLCLATQMPRDIPHGTLSQMGTFIVHRLINHNDKEAINNACSSANKNTLDFLPILGEGEAILTGVDFAMPVIMKFHEPKNKPNSKTPRLK
jgi:hypothetical protein